VAGLGNSEIHALSRFDSISVSLPPNRAATHPQPLVCRLVDAVLGMRTADWTDGGEAGVLLANRWQAGRLTGGMSSYDR
jgi:hypothetical protein